MVGESVEPFSVYAGMSGCFQRFTLSPTTQPQRGSLFVRLLHL